MSDRIDQIETAIHDIISTDLESDSAPMSRTGSELAVAARDKSDSIGLTGHSRDQGGDATKSDNDGDQSLLLAEPPFGVMQGSPGSP
jgi:hypothetical protein